MSHDVKNNNNGPVLASAKINKSLLPIATWSLLNARGPHGFGKINAQATNWSFTVCVYRPICVYIYMLIISLYRYH